MFYKVTLFVFVLFPSIGNAVDATQSLKPESNNIAEMGNSTQIKQKSEIVKVTNSWIREPVVKSDIHAGYFTLFNTSDKDLVLESVETNAYKTVEIHEMKHVNGMMKMKKLDSLTIPANGEIKLAPRGMHLMLIKPMREIKSGGKVMLTLKFKNGKTQKLIMPIKSNLYRK